GLETDPFPSWMGHSVGRWEGDTLVVDSNGFNDRSWLDHDGHPHSEALRITERYRRVDFGHMNIEVTLNDPQVYAHPWTVSLRAELTPDGDLLESVCNESHTSLEHWVGKLSDEKSVEVKVSSEILAKYVGPSLGKIATKRHKKSQGPKRNIFVILIQRVVELEKVKVCSRKEILLRKIVDKIHWFVVRFRAKLPLCYIELPVVVVVSHFDESHKALLTNDFIGRCGGSH